MTKAVVKQFSEKNYPGKRAQTVCGRSTSRKCRGLDALGPRDAREVMVVIKVGIVVTVAVVVNE